WLAIPVVLLMVPARTSCFTGPKPPAPYPLLTNTRTLQPGQPITVTSEYGGVLLEAQTGRGSRALGSSLLPPPDTKFLEVTYMHLKLFFLKM
ncbi:hypothetical protein INR49_015540, partial [Caranx melampygus]